MAKEWLEFFGGLFVFLAALVPVIRGLWRALRRKLAPKEVGLLFLVIINFGFGLFGLIGLFLNWMPAVEMICFLIYIIGSAAFFASDGTPVTRKDVALFVFTMVAAASFLAVQFSKVELAETEAAKHKASPKPVPSVSPSNPPSE